MTSVHTVLEERQPTKNSKERYYAAVSECIDFQMITSEAHVSLLKVGAYAERSKG